MTMMQLFGKHDVVSVTLVPTENKRVSISTAHYEEKRDIANDVSVSMFFDSVEEAAKFVLDMLTKVIAEMKEKHDAETR